MHRNEKERPRWLKACRQQDIPPGGGACVKLGDHQIAVFHISRPEGWYATQNLCPHKQQMALSRGITGDAAGEPKVACPFHKKTFSLKTGGCLSDPGIFQIRTYPVKTVDGFVLIGVTENDPVCPEAELSS